MRPEESVALLDPLDEVLAVLLRERKLVQVTGRVETDGVEVLEATPG